MKRNTFGLTILLGILKLTGSLCFPMSIIMILFWNSGDIMGLGVSNSMSFACKIIFCILLIIPTVTLYVLRITRLINQKQFLLYISSPVLGSTLGFALIYFINFIANI